MFKTNVLFFLFFSLTFAKSCFSQDAYRISGVYSPYFDAYADIDPKELNGGILFDHDLRSGHGAGLKLSKINNQYKTTTVLSLAYYQGRQKEIENKKTVRSHSLYFEIGPEYNYMLSKDINPFMAFMVGAGAVKFDFQNNESQEWGGASELGFQLGVKFLGRFKTSIGGAYYLWGYPGETMGYGVNISSEIGIEF